MSAEPICPGRVRGLAALAAVLTVVAGLGLRAVTSGLLAKAGGDALYTVLVCWLVRLAAPRLRPLPAAALALAFSWAVEFLQLTPYPAELSRHSVLARLVLGSVFEPSDLLWYTVGALLLLGVQSLKPRGRGPNTAGRPAA